MGRAVSARRKRRSELLSELLAALRVLRLRMLNSAEPLGVLMRKSDSLLFRDLGNSLWEGGGLEQCWQSKRSEYCRGNGLLAPLAEEELRILDGFFQQLGKSGKQEQNQLFSASIGELEEKQSSARRSYLETSKLYTALGTLVGIGICILIV